MKNLKVLLVSAFALVALTTSAQQAIGLRFGGGNLNGAEVSYQMPMGDVNRLQLDLGINGDDDYFSLGVTGTYQWTWGIADVEGLAWYAGPGATVGFWAWDNGVADDSGANIGIGGIVGIEYTFAGAPIQLSLDTRPMFNLLGSDDYNGNWGAALAVRYVF